MLTAAMWFFIGIVLGALTVKAFGWLRVVVVVAGFGVVGNLSAGSATIVVHNVGSSTIDSVTGLKFSAWYSWQTGNNFNNIAAGGSETWIQDTDYGGGTTKVKIHHNPPGYTPDITISAGQTYHVYFDTDEWVEGAASYVWWGCVTNGASVAELYNLDTSYQVGVQNRVLSPGEWWCAGATNSSPFTAGFSKLVFGPEGAITVPVFPPTWAGTNNPGGGGGTDSGGNLGSNTGDDLTADLLGKLLLETQRLRTNVQDGIGGLRSDVGDMAVDTSGIESNTDGLEGNTDGLEGMLDGVESSLSSVAANTAAAAVSASSVNTNLSALQSAFSDRLLALQSNTLWGLERVNTNVTAVNTNLATGLSVMNSNLVLNTSNILFLATNEWGVASNQGSMVGTWVQTMSNETYATQQEIYSGIAGAVAARARPGPQAGVWVLPFKKGLSAGSEVGWNLDPRQLSWWEPVGAWMRYIVVWAAAIWAVLFIMGVYQQKVEVLYGIPGGSPTKSSLWAIPGWTAQMTIVLACIVAFPLALAGVWTVMSNLVGGAGYGMGSPFSASMVASTFGTGQQAAAFTDVYDLATNFIPLDALVSIGLWVLGAWMAAARLLGVNAVKVKVVGT